jgi:GNAT superfamily N-acetyltransferase
MPPPPDSSSPAIAIRRWADLPDPERYLPALDAIFFEASATKSFASDEDRAAFRERWLGRYLVHDPGFAYLAIAADGTLAGYLAGAIDDPARAPRFSDIGYNKDFAPLTAAYPAHLHVNLSPAYRNGGIGAALVAAFAADAARAGAKGVHVVTGAGSRNVGFYARNGFAELARSAFNGHEVVFLGRRL